MNSIDKKFYKLFVLWINIFFLLNSCFASLTIDDLANEKGVENQRLIKILKIVIPTIPSSLVENLTQEEKTTLIKDKVIEVAKTIQQRGKFSDYIYNLSENKKWNEILKLTQNQDYIIPLEYLRENFLTQQYFNYMHAVSQAYHELARRSDILIAEQYYHQIIKICSQYLENIQIFQPDTDEDHIGSLLNSSIINSDLAGAHLNLFMILVAPDVSEELTCYLWKAASSYNKAISSFTNIRQFNQKKFRDLREDHRKFNNDCKDQLFVCYLGLISQGINNNVSSMLFVKAKEILLELKDTSESYNFYKNNLEIIEKEFQVQILSEGKEKIGPAVRKRLINKLRKETAILNHKSLNDETIDFNTHLSTLFLQFSLMESEPEKALIILKQIENQVQEKLNQQNKNFEENLEEIYKYIINSKCIKSPIDKIICCFLDNNDIGSALKRAELFEELEKENLDTSLNSAKIWIAYLKSLQGDYQSWLEIENKLDQVKQKKRADLKLKQEKKHEKHICRIQEDIKKKQKEKEQLEQKLKEERHKQVEIRKITNEIHQNSSFEGQENDAFSDENISNQQQRFEKHQRHQERLKQKEENFKQNDEKEIPKVAKLAQDKLDLNEKNSLAIVSQENIINISSLLTGLALKIDLEIEHNTWNFTKDQLQYYFEVLGCTAYSGKGSHTKISFPKMTHVMYKNHFITLMGEEGGALTLPQWKDKVPSYLKKQISLARQKIFQLKQKL